MKIFHNAKFDLQFFEKAGVCAAPVFDTMLAAELLPCGGPRKGELWRLCRSIIWETLDKTEQTGDWSGSPDRVPA